MLISIVTPTYDSLRFLPGAVESVATQTHAEREHIVVDGASRDGTADYLAALDGVRWLSEPDRGMYDAVNKGLRLAQGEVLAYLNADDRYYPHTLEVVARAFAADPGLDFVYGYITYMDEREQPICTFRAVPFLPRLQKRGRICFGQPSCFWRRRVHERVGYFDADFRNSADADFFHRLLEAELRGRLVRQPMSRFMVRQDCISKTLRENMRREEGIIWEKFSLKRRSWRYALNELFYYALNIDSYCRYIARRLTG